MLQLMSRLPSPPPLVLVALVAPFLAGPALAQDLDSPRVAKARDKQCVIEVRGKDSAFIVSAFGLVPNEYLEITSESAGEVIQYPANADASGEYHFIEIPLVKGTSSGIARITVTASRCRLRVSFPWRE